MNLSLIFGILATALAGAILWILVRRGKTPALPDPAFASMQQQVESLREQVAQSLAQNASLLHNQLNTVAQNMQSSSGEINQRLDNAARLYSELRGQLGQLAQANTQIQAMVKDVSSLQDILRPPKLRGGMGEVLLENLLREILPTEHYAMQHRFKSGHIVDCIITLKEGLVPVDAKFPLENFRRMLEATDDDTRRSARKEFVRNVRKHIDDIRTRYILPDEGTFPFALMYIPAENVYYETIIKMDDEDSDKAIYSYAIAQQVMPVSPNSFYAYLLTLSQGFRGMRIEERTRDILQHLNRLRLDLARFGEDFQKVGAHLGNAQSSFDKAEKRFTRFEEKLAVTGEHALEETEVPLELSEPVAGSSPN